jgi:hypothetical protein
VVEATGIPESILGIVVHPEDSSVACRMSWAARRVTTRVEDEAYCLLGMFGINMPLIYGEGHRAFTRLQEEILKKSRDQSIFAWGYMGLDITGSTPISQDTLAETGWPLLAGHPSWFRDSGDIVFGESHAYTKPWQTFQVTPEGVETDATLVLLNAGRRGSSAPRIQTLRLNCKWAPEDIHYALEEYKDLPFVGLPLIPLSRKAHQPTSERQYYRRVDATPFWLPDAHFEVLTGNLTIPARIVVPQNAHVFSEVELRQRSHAPHTSEVEADAILEMRLNRLRQFKLGEKKRLLLILDDMRYDDLQARLDSLRR